MTTAADRTLLLEICRYLEDLYPGVPTAAREARKIKAHLQADQDVLLDRALESERLAALRRDAQSRNAVLCSAAGIVALKVVVDVDAVTIDLPTIQDGDLQHLPFNGDRDAFVLHRLKASLVLPLRPGRGDPNVAPVDRSRTARKP